MGNDLSNPIVYSKQVYRVRLMSYVYFSRSPYTLFLDEYITITSGARVRTASNMLNVPIAFPLKSSLGFEIEVVIATFADRLNMAFGV